MYKRDVMFDRAQYKNDMALADIDQDKVYRAMIDQWSQTDQQLDRIFAEGDQKIERAVVEMYKNDYAGTQTGKTAARLAGQSARELGQYKSGVLHTMMMSQKEGEANKEMAWNKAQQDSRSIYEKVRFAPIHGPTPIAPELEAKPSSAGMILGLAGAAVQGFKDFREFKASGIGSGKGGGGGSTSSTSFNTDLGFNYGSGMDMNPYSSGTSPWG